MPKKIPLRQCVGCREMKPKKELIRVVKSPEGEVSLDFKGAFSAAMPDGVYDALEAQMREGGDG